MKISIIIPVYNVEKYLSNLLDTIIYQTYKNYEVIMIDDGSNDNSYNIMREYSKKDSRFKSFTHKNIGPGLTRKEGYEKATGELLFFVDSDDLLSSKNVLKNIVSVFQKNEIDFLIFESKKMPDDGKANKAITKGNIKRGIHDINELNDCIVEGCLWLKVFKSSIFNSSFFIDSNNYEDFYTTYKYINYSKKFYYLDKKLYIVNRLDDNISLTKNKSIDKVLKAIDIIMMIIDFSNIKDSAKLLGLDFYMSNVKRLFTFKDNISKRYTLYKKLKLLRKKIKKDAINLCKKKFKRKALYLYLITKIFV